MDAYISSKLSPFPGEAVPTARVPEPLRFHKFGSSQLRSLRYFGASKPRSCTRGSPSSLTAPVPPKPKCSLTFSAPQRPKVFAALLLSPRAHGSSLSRFCLAGVQVLPAPLFPQEPGSARPAPLRPLSSEERGSSQSCPSETAFPQALENSHLPPVP